MTMRRAALTARRRQSGIALILVIWVAALMVLFAAAFSFSVRGEVRLALRESERIRAAAAAEAGLRRTLLLMSDDASAPPLDEELTEQPTTSRRQYRLAFDGVDLTVQVVPEPNLWCILPIALLLSVLWTLRRRP